MSCTINIRINGKDYAIENVDNLDRDYSLKDVLEQINKHIDDGNNKEVWEEIKMNLSRRNSSKINLEGLPGTIIANHNISSIANKYKYLFEDIDTSSFANTLVLLARDSQALADKNLSFGTRLVLNGQELFIIEDSYNTIKSFTNFLKVRKYIADKKYIKSSADIQILKSFPEFSSFEELLIDFMSDNDKYKGTKEYRYLDEKYRDILKLNLRYQYNYDSLTELNAILNYNNGTPFVELSYFVNILLRNKELSTLPNLKVSEFYKFYSKPFRKIYEEDKSVADILNLSYKELDNYLNSTKSGIEVIVEFLANKDPNFELKYKNSTNKVINFNYSNLTFEEAYGNDYLKTIERFTPIRYYKSYGIFTDNNGNFFISKLFIVRSSKGVKRETSEIDAEKQINLRFSKDKIGLESSVMRGIYTGDDINPIFRGRTARVLLLPKLSYNLNKLERNLINKDFSVFEFFNSFIFNENWAKGLSEDLELINKMKEILDDSLKIVALFYLINEGKNNKTLDNPKTKEEIELALNKISKLEYDYYDIVDTFKKGRQHKLEVKNQEYALEEASNLFYSKFHAFELLKNRLEKSKIQIELTTTDLLPVLFEHIIPNIKEIRGLIKSFIHNDKIYINVDTASLNDFAHEYYHIILGIIKATNLKCYMDLMNKFKSLILQDKFVSNIYNKIKQKESIYYNFSEIDQIEEALVQVLGNYVANGQTGALETNDFDSELIIRKLINDLFFSVSKENVFDLEQLQDYLITDMTLLELLNKLKIFSQGSLNWINDMFPKNKESIFKQRKITNYIELQIANNNLIKDCSK